jgi:hypothetical protein
MSVKTAVIQSHACRADPVLLPSHQPTLGYGRLQIQLLRGHLLSYDAREVEAALTSLAALAQDHRTAHDVFDTETAAVIARHAASTDEPSSDRSRRLALEIIAALYASPAHRAKFVADAALQGALRRAIHDPQEELRRISAEAFKVITSMDSAALAVEANFVQDFVRCIKEHGDVAAIAVLNNLLALGGRAATTATLDAGGAQVLVSYLEAATTRDGTAASLAMLTSLLGCLRSLALSARGKGVCIECGVIAALLPLCDHQDSNVRLAAVGGVMVCH